MTGVTMSREALTYLRVLIDVADGVYPSGMPQG
jgi:hypothetical protein